MAKQRINLPLLVKAAAVIPTVKLVLDPLGFQNVFYCYNPSDVNCSYNRLLSTVFMYCGAPICQV